MRGRSVFLLRTFFTEPRSEAKRPWLAPLEFLALASYLRAKGVDARISIFDMGLTGDVTIDTALRDAAPGDILGLSPRQIDYTITLEAARRAKDKGLTVVLGGANATHLGTRILARHYDIVDAVVQYDGERPFLRIVSGDDPASVPAVLTRRRGVLVLNGETIEPADYYRRLGDVALPSLAEYPILDYTMLDLDGYGENFRRQRGSVAISFFGEPRIVRNPTSRVSQRGCTNRFAPRPQMPSGCVFCGCLEPSWRGRPVDQVIEEEEALAALGVDGIADMCDDILASKRWFHDYYEAKAKGSRGLPIIFVMARFDKIDAEVAGRLRDIGVHRAFLGLESADETCLRLSGKRGGITQERQRHAVETLAAAGVGVSLSYTFGMPGETRASLERSYAQAERFLETFGREHFDVYYSDLNPQPGSRAFQLLLDAQTAGHLFRCDYVNADVFDVKDAIQDWRDYCRSQSPEFPEDAAFSEIDMRFGRLNAAYTVSEFNRFYDRQRVEET